MTANSTSAGDQRSADYLYPTWNLRMHRPEHGLMLAGVAAGVAEYLGVETVIVRIVLVVLTVAGAAGVPIYLAGWLLIPAEDAERSIASQFLARVGGSH